MPRYKSSSDKCRVIIDFSWPKGQSVNSGANLDKYLGTESVLTYPSIHNITDQVLQLGRGGKIFKVDISGAFCHVPIDPGELDLLGLHWDHYFIDFLLPFGLKHGYSIFLFVRWSSLYYEARGPPNLELYRCFYCVWPYHQKFTILIVVSRTSYTNLVSLYARAN